MLFFFFFKQKTAYEIYQCDWSSDVCSSDLSSGGFTGEWVNGEDADLALRLGVASGFVQISSPETFAYREHDDSAMKDLTRTLAGVKFMIHTENAGSYPGGKARALNRWRILTRHIRPVTLDCLKQGLFQDAWALYRATFGWNAALGYWKYLIGFPVLALRSSKLS